MPREALPSYLKVTEPYQAQPKQYSSWEVFSNGVRSGLQENTISYLSDYATKLKATRNPELEEITEEEFYALPGYKEGMKYYPGMTYALYNQYTEAYNRQVQTQLIKQNSDNFYLPYFGGALLSGFADPVNFIPLGLPVKGAGILLNAARVGGANAAIELGIAPLTGAAYRARSQEATPIEHATNIMLAFAVGSVLGGGIAGAGKLRDMMTAIPAMRIEGEFPTLTQIMEQRPDNFKINETIENMLNKKLIRMSDNPGVHIRNTDPFADNTVKIVDTTGSIHLDVKNVRSNKYVKVQKLDNTDTPTYTITGPNRAVLQTALELGRYIPDGDNINVLIKRTDKTGATVRVTGKSGLTSWTNKEASKIGRNIATGEIKTRGSFFGEVLRFKEMKQLEEFKPVLEDAYGLRTTFDDADVNYEIESNLTGEKFGFDPAEGIGKIFEVKGKRKKQITDPVAINKVFKQFQEMLRKDGQTQRVSTAKSTVSTEQKMKDLMPGGDDEVNIGMMKQRGEKDSSEFSQGWSRNLNKELKANKDPARDKVKIFTTASLRNFIEKIESSGMVPLRNAGIRFDETAGEIRFDGDIVPTQSYDVNTLRTMNALVKQKIDKQPNVFVKLDEAGTAYKICKLENK
jgi:hypothetical protein